MNKDKSCIKLGNLCGHTGGSFHGMVYDLNGLAPTLSSMQGGNTQPMIISTNGTEIAGTIRASYYKNGERNIIENIKHGLGYEGVIELKRLGNVYGDNFGTGYAGNVWDKEGLCPTIKVESGGGGRQPMVMVAMRGRYNEDGSTSQRLEIGDEECSHAITTVQKDGMIMEEVNVKKIGSVYNDGSECGAVVKDDGLASTVVAGTHGYANTHIATKVKAIDEQNMDIRNETVGTIVTDGSSPKHNNRILEEIHKIYRIRKLTPRECYRLMGISDEDYNKAAEVSSATQLYKQAGNSICVNVLVAIFGQIFGGHENDYIKFANTLQY